MLGPIAHLLLSEGIGAREFQDIVRREFGRAAIQKGAQSSPPATTDSDVHSLTGISRRDVTKIRKADAGRDDAEDVGQHRAERVLNAWCQDPEFEDGSGKPARLPLRVF